MYGKIRFTHRQIHLFDIKWIKIIFYSKALSLFLFTYFIFFLIYQHNGTNKLPLNFHWSFEISIQNRVIKYLITNFIRPFSSFNLLVFVSNISLYTYPLRLKLSHSNYKIIYLLCYQIQFVQMPTRITHPWLYPFRSLFVGRLLVEQPFWIVS